ncbi:hypothetical protein [Chromobacterium violaceum]|uniref:hypothetical protein n=1 Tax=Chromobacterium violaceum TaxID=536 RepID=UPI001CE067F2|nr:hypothetical protein [Chromobacterium violaceum]
MKLVLQVSSAPLAELDRFYAPPNPQGKGQRQCLWHKYQKGLVSPKDDGAMGQASVIGLVEQDYRGTATWYRHLFWSVLERKALTWPEIQQVYLQLKGQWRYRLIDERHAREEFWRSREGIRELGAELIASPTLDAGTVILCLIAEARLRLNRSDYLSGREAFACWLEQSPFRQKFAYSQGELLQLFADVLGRDVLRRLGDYRM